MKTKVLVFLMALFFAVTAAAIEPTVITFSWDYKLADNPDVVGFQVFEVDCGQISAGVCDFADPAGQRLVVATVALPSPLPVPGPDGFAVFSTDVVPDKTGRKYFVAIATTIELLIFSRDSNVVSVVIKPDPTRNLRK